MFADLHMHTCYSDGAQTPCEVVEASRVRGLSVISICDHNTIKAYDELKAAVQGTGITLVQGVELDVYHRGKLVHLLGYAFDPGFQPLAELMAKTRSELEQISVEMVKRMLPDYPRLSMEDYQAFAYAPGEGGWKGLHYLRAGGLTDKLMDGLAFHKKYGGFVPDYFSVEDACGVIKQAGGVPVLAHPGCWWPEVSAELEATFDDLRKLGIEGIECYYPEHSQAYTEFCTTYCRSHDMRITCGGDGHGGFNNTPGGVIHDIGILRVDMMNLDLKGIVR